METFFIILLRIIQPPEITTLIAVLSTAIYLLSSNHVTQEEIRNSEKLLLTFQRGVHKLCGDSAMTYSLHAISHLPMQVNWFGPLWSFSASMFESAFGHLTSFVTGTQNKASLMINRFIRYHGCVMASSIATVPDNYIKNRYGAITFGIMKPVPLEILLYDLLFDCEIFQTYKVYVNSCYFTSYQYYRKGSSAFLPGNDDGKWYYRFLEN